MHPSESSLNSFGFLKVFLDLLLPLSLESVFLVVHHFPGACPRHDMWSHIIVSRGIPWTTRRVCCSTFHKTFAPPPPGAVLTASRGNGNGVDCRFFRCGSTKSTLLPCVRSAAGLSCDVEFLKMASSFACIAHELSAWSLLIVSILVSRLPNWLFTASYRCFISCMSFLMFLPRSPSVASTLSDIC